MKTPGSKRLLPVIPVLVITTDEGDYVIVEIPRMLPAAFEFFRKMLDIYRPAIVIQDEPGALTDDTRGLHTLPTVIVGDDSSDD